MTLQQFNIPTETAAIKLPGAKEPKRSLRRPVGDILQSEENAPAQQDTHRLATACVLAPDPHLDVLHVLHVCRPIRSKLTHMASQQAAPAAASSQPGLAERQAVIFLVDSHTRGFYGASWLRLLKPQFPHLHFVNAGNDGEPSESIAARLPGLLAAHPDPAAVFIFSGSNDCIAQQTQDLQDYYKRTFRLSQYCSEQYALDKVEEMLQLVQKQAPKAKVSSSRLM